MGGGPPRPGRCRGHVRHPRVAPHLPHGAVTVATTRQAEPLLTDQTVFWVVKPRLFAGNISGLDTLLSGSYIGMMPGAAVMFMASGLTMAALRWRGPYPFVAVGLVTILGIWTTSAVVGGRHLRAMRAAIGEGDGPVSPTFARVVLHPARWGTMGALNGAALGVLFVMTTKLGWVAAIAVVLSVAALVGGIFTAAVRRQRDALEEAR